MHLMMSALTAWLAASGDLAVVQGNVTSDRGRPVAGAQVLIEAFGIGAVTNQAGEFELTAPAGLRTITVRAIGYQSTIITLNLSESEPTAVTIELRQLPQLLDSVTATVEAPPIVSAKMAGFDPVLDYRQQLRRDPPLDPGALTVGAEAAFTSATNAPVSPCPPEWSSPRETPPAA